MRRGAGERRGATPAAVPDYFRSVDSTPAAYALSRPASVANGFLLNFTAASMVILVAAVLVLNVDSAGSSRDFVVASGGGERAAIPVRSFVTAFFLVFAWSVASNRWRRALIGLQLLGTFAVIVLAVDFGAALADALGVTTPVVGQQIVSGLIAHGDVPRRRDPQRAPAGAGGRPADRCRSGGMRGCGCRCRSSFGFAMAASIERYGGGRAKRLRNVALMGGIGPGIFLVQQLFAIMTAGSASSSCDVRVGMTSPHRSRCWSRPTTRRTCIAATIDAVEHAAAAPTHGTVRLYVVDNASTDHTIDGRRDGDRALRPPDRRRCSSATRRARRSRSTTASPHHRAVRRPDRCRHRHRRELLRRMPCATSPTRRSARSVGCRYPRRTSTFFDRARLVEVLLRHGFFQISLLGYDGIIGIPGMFVAYRKDALDRAGAIVQGMNGEDTDICLRMSAAGYRSMAEPRPCYQSETPRSWAHMREQRTRWFRSIYHLAGHNRHTIFGRAHDGRGDRACRSSSSTRPGGRCSRPMLIFATLLLVVFHSVLPTLRWQSVVATVSDCPPSWRSSSACCTDGGVRCSTCRSTSSSGSSAATTRWRRCSR